MAACFSLAAQAAESIPFSSSLTTQEELDRWTIIDADGNIEGPTGTWHIAATDMGGDCATSWTDASTYTPIDHQLITPALALTANVEYVIKFTYYTSYYNDEAFAVYLSETPSLAADAQPIEEMSLRNYYGAKKSIMLPAIDHTGEYYIILRHTSSGPEGMLIGIKDFSVTTMQDGNVEGHVYTYVDGNRTPVEGVTVTFSGPSEYTAVSDSEGYYRINEITSAEYTVDYSKYGYQSPSSLLTVNVDAATTTTYDITIYEMLTNSVTGTVTDNAGNPLQGARIKVDGYGHHEAVTGSDGKFSVGNVYVNGGYSSPSRYTVTIDKNNFEQVSRSVNVSYYTGAELGEVAMKYKALDPSSVKAETVADGVQVSWTRPIDNADFTYDNGNPGRSNGYNGGTEYNIVGNVQRTPMTVSSVSWYRKSEEYSAEPPENVILYIIGLDREGNPDTSHFLYQNMAIPSKLDEWTTFNLPQPVSAPNGCIVALSCYGYVSLAIDDSEEMAPAGTQIYSTTYVGGYTSFDQVNWKGAYMLRVKGEPIEQGNFQPQITYSLYRYNANVNTIDFETPLKENTTDMSFVDKDFNSLDQGSYYYVVYASYPVDKIKSEGLMSNYVYKDMYTTVNINVTADSDPADAENAVIILKSTYDDKSYSATVRNGKARFENVWKTGYDVTVRHNGFTVDATHFDFTRDAEYTKDLVLKQIVRPVNNIDIDANNGAYTLMWDLFADIYDDFEGDDHADFTINPAGAAGWSYVDNDGYRTYGFGATTFPGMRSPMAAILFNAVACDPPLSKNVASSGNRFLAFFAAYPTEVDEGLILNMSDDYLISPRLDFHRDFTLSFSAVTYESIEGRYERFRVGYSTTSPELDNFQYVTDGYVDVPDGEISLYSYDIPKEARYVTINSSSDDVFMLAMDDISLSTGIAHSGEPASVGAFKGYNIYLDGQLIATQTANTLPLTNLTSGTHTAEVSKVFAGGESRRMSITFNAETGIGNIGADTDADAPVEYFNLQGQRISNPAQGQVVIRRQGTRAEKIIMR